MRALAVPRLRSPAIAAVISSSPLAEQDQQRARFDQGAAALDHDLEDAVEVGLAADRAGDLGRRFKSVHGALHLVAAALHAAVEAGVLDRDRRPLGEDHRRLFVGLVEVAAALLGQVEVAPGVAADHHRHAEEVRHRWVAGGEAVGAGVATDLGQAQRARLLDQQAEHAAAARQVADRAARLLVDAVGDEALQFVAVLIEHAEGGVAGPGQVAGDLEHLLEDHLGVELGDEAAPDVDQLPQTGLVQGAAVRPLCHLSAVSIPPTHGTVDASILSGQRSNIQSTLSTMPAGEPGQRGEVGVTTIVLADDHTVVRNALRLLLDAEPGFEVVAEAGDVDTAVRYVRGHKPTVLILDLNMPGRSSLDAVPDLRAASPQTEIVVLTMQNEPAFARRALQAGVRGYVVKEAADAELVQAVRSAAAGDTYLQPALGARLAAGENGDNEDELSERERDVLRLIALGHTNAEVAEQLYISIRTVESHRAHIQQKLGLTSRAELVRYALKRGLVET